jgi:bile acid:Na+ symporter, BASS family
VTPDLVFSDAAVVGVNVVLAVIMFGVGLDLDLAEFRRTLRTPKGPVVGLVTQFLVLPAVAFVVIRLLAVEPAIAVGMLVVAASPGGTVSNVITHLADGNTSLSIAMTTVSTFVAMVMTPANLAFYSARVPAVQELGVSLDPVNLVLTLLLVMGVPVAVGVLLQVVRPAVAARLLRPMRIVAVGGLLAIIVGALVANAGSIVSSLQAVAVAVILLNAIALGLGYGAGRAFRLGARDCRAVAIEVGIQNSALALTLVLRFFPDLGGAALVAAFWGIWHMISGLLLARVWSGRSLFTPAPHPSAPHPSAPYPGGPEPVAD